MRRAGGLLLAMLVLASGLSGAATPYEIFIDVDGKQLFLFRDEALLRTYTVATGAWDTPTPLGVFYINSRFSGEMSGFGTCFLGLSVP